MGFDSIRLFVHLILADPNPRTTRQRHSLSALLPEIQKFKLRSTRGNVEDVVPLSASECWKDRILF